MPFLLPALLVIVGMVIRLKLEESDDMKHVLAQKGTVKLPLKDVVYDHWGLVLLGAGTLPLIHVAYLKSNFALVWAMKELSYAQNIFLGIIAIALVVQFITQPLGAWLASRMDMRRVICLVALSEFLFMPVMSFTIKTKMIWVALPDMCLAAILHSMFYGTISGIPVRAFPMRVRYTGLSLAYQLYSFVVGGDTPVFVQWMLSNSGNIVDVTVSSALYALVSLVCTLVLPNRTRRHIDELSAAEHTDAVKLGQGDVGVSRPLTDPVGKPVAAVWVAGVTTFYTKHAVAQLPHLSYNDKASHA